MLCLDYRLLRCTFPRLPHAPSCTASNHNAASARLINYEEGSKELQEASHRMTRRPAAAGSVLVIRFLRFEPLLYFWHQNGNSVRLRKV